MGRRFLWIGFLCLAGSLVRAEGGGAVLIVLNQDTATKGAKTGSIAFLDPETFEAAGSVDVGLVPAGAVLSPDEQFVYVFAGPKGRGPSGTVAVVEIASKRLVATVDAGEEPWPVGFSPDGARLYCLDSGAKERKAVLTVIDRATHAKVASVEVPSLAVEAALSPDATRVYVLQRDVTAKDTPGRLAVVDTRENKVVRNEAVGPAPAQMTLSPDKAWLYVLDFGKPSKDKTAHKDGALLVLDSATGDLATTLPVGAVPTRMAIQRDTGSVYVGARETFEAKTGFLLGIRGRERFGRLELGERPESVRAAADTKDVFVIGERSVSVVDPDLKQERRLAVKLDQVISLDGRHAALAVSDTPLFSGALVAALAAAAKGQEQVQAGRFSPPTVPRGRDAEPFTAVALRRDGRFLYGLDTLANRLNVVDTETHQVVGKIETGLGAYELLLLPSGRHLFVKSVTELTVIGTSKNAAVARHELGSGGKARPFVGALYPRREVGFSDARRIGLVADGKKLHVLNLRTGATVMAVSLPSPLQALVPAAVNTLPSDRAAIEEILDRVVAFEEEGKLAEAVAEYRKAQAIAPADRTYVTQPVALLVKAGREQEAFAEMRRWLDQAPSDAARCWTAATLYMQRGRYGDAVPLLECAVSGPLPPDVPPGMPRLELARGYLAVRNLEAALRLAEEARKLGDVRAEALIKQIRAAR